MRLLKVIDLLIKLLQMFQEFFPLLLGLTNLILANLCLVAEQMAIYIILIKFDLISRLTPYLRIVI